MNDIEVGDLKVIGEEFRLTLIKEGVWDDLFISWKEKLSIFIDYDKSEDLGCYISSFGVKVEPPYHIRRCGVFKHCTLIMETSGKLRLPIRADGETVPKGVLTNITESLGTYFLVLEDISVEISKEEENSVSLAVYRGDVCIRSKSIRV